MPRRLTGQEHTSATARQRIARLSGTPLDVIARRLEAVLQGAADFNSPEVLGKISQYIIHLNDRLPESFGARFCFDAALIKSLELDWSANLTFSNMIVPRHSPLWGHERLTMPSEDAMNAHVIDLIHVQGQDRLEEVNLLSYPWLIHELGRYVLLHNEQLFIPDFTAGLSKLVSKLRLASIADRGVARSRAQRTLEELEQFWTPGRDQRNWAHELGIDLLALWTIGPAYIASFLDVLEDPQTNPFEITQSHPPYAVRAEALMRGAAKLDLSKYATKIEALTHTWPRSQWKKHRNNRFLALSTTELVDACINVAFSFCDSLKLTKCTPTKVDEMLKRPVNYSSDELGLDLILWSWAVFEGSGKDAYASWETETVNRLAALITS